jgi:hypothetical protein
MKYQRPGSSCHRLYGIFTRTFRFFTVSPSIFGDNLTTHRALHWRRRRLLQLARARGRAEHLTITVVNTANSCSPLDASTSRSGNATPAEMTLSTEVRQARPTCVAFKRRTPTARSHLRRFIRAGIRRATHIHVEVTRGASSLKVTQIAFPESVNNEVYGSGVYASRGSTPTTNTRDGFFADSLNSELATVTGQSIERIYDHIRGQISSGEGGRVHRPLFID